MYELVTLIENSGYGKEIVTPSDKKKVIFSNSSQAHVSITAVDPATGNCVEVMVRKDALPDFITHPKEE